MTWTYSGNPTTSTTDEIRFLIGDTDSSDPLLQDEEIAYLYNTWYTIYGTVFYVASIACETIAASYAREASHSADGVSLQLGEIQAKFTKQAETLREQHASLLIGGIPDVGGVTAGEQPDPMIAPLIFGTGMSDNISAGRQDYGSRDFPEYFPEQYPGY
jgi:hypothetical protein